MINTVPAASVVGMGFSLLVAFALPITLFILCRKRLNAARLPALIGALTFTVAVLVLENAAHGLLRPLTSSPAVQGSVLLTAVYGGLMAALFEEFGRLAAMKLFMKKTLTKENALMYGVGHGGIEAVLTAGILYISNLATAIMVNTGSIGAALGTLDKGRDSRKPVRAVYDGLLPLLHGGGGAYFRHRAAYLSFVSRLSRAAVRGEAVFLRGDGAALRGRCRNGAACRFRSHTRAGAYPSRRHGCCRVACVPAL